MKTIEIKFNDKILAIAELEDKELNGKIRPCLKITMSKAKKPLVNNYFLELAHRDLKLEQVTKNLIDHENEKIKRKDNQKIEAAKFRDALKIGTILEASWGYEQTNVDFYQVVGLNKNKTKVQLRELGLDEVPGSGESHGMSCKVIPGQFIGAIIERSVLSNYIKLHSSAALDIWDGKPKYKSWYY